MWQLSFSEYIAFAWSVLLHVPEAGHRIREASMEWDIPPWPDREHWGNTADQMSAMPPPARLRSDGAPPAAPSAPAESGEVDGGSG